MEEGKTTMEEGKTTTVEEGKTVEVGKTVKTEEGKAMEEGKTVKTEEGKTAEEGNAVKTEEGKTAEEGKSVTTEEGKAVEEGKSVKTEEGKTADEGKNVKTEEGKTADEGKTMKAVQYEAYGGGADALKHVEVPVPTPEKDDILIKVEAVGINPIDWRLQNGMLRPLSPSKFPYIPLCDIAGEVVEVGSEVKNFKPGDKVVAMLPLSTGGGLAEYAVAKENLTVSRPAGVSAADGAGLPTAGLTAHQAVSGPAGIKLDGSEPKKNILITAASGGVGSYAVQLAKLGNAHVTATCGARNIDLVKSLGADEVLDYKTPEGAALKSPSGLKYDAVIHCAKDISWSTFSPNLSTHGKVIEITPVLKTMWTVAVRKLTFSKKQMVPLLLSAKGENLDYLVGLVKDGKLKTVIDSKYPLDKAEEAWAKSAEGHAMGKVIVEI